MKGGRRGRLGRWIHHEHPPFQTLAPDSIEPRERGCHERRLPLAAVVTREGVAMELTKRVLNVQKPSDPEGAIIEAWAQGFMVKPPTLISSVLVRFS